MKKCRKFGKRFLAGMCVTAMLVSSLGPGIQTAAASRGPSRKQMERDMEAAIKESLKNEDPAIKKDYPKGIFSFATLQGEVNEENKEPLAVYLVRHGGTKGKQTVPIKFSDYSAEYGKDYYAKLDDSIFTEKVETNPDSVPLFYMFDDDPNGDGKQTAIDEESVIAAYGEERGKRIIELTKEYSEAEAKAAQKAKEAASEDKKADDTTQQANPSSPLEQLADETSQYTDSGYSLTMEELLTDEERNENTATYGANMLDTIFPGAETELVFEDGESIKKIYVYPIDNKVSDGDRVLSVQINNRNKDLAWQEGENASTVTIIDDEQDETGRISIKSCPKSIGTDGKASITLQRKKGLYKVSTVEFVVKAAKKEVAKGTAIFMPNMKERTVEFSVGDVDAKTVDSIDFELQNPVGAKLAADHGKTINLTELRVRKYATVNSKDVSEEDSPVGLNGTLSLNGIDLDLRNFVEDDRANCSHITFSTDPAEMKLHIPKSSNCGCAGARIAATLKKQINQEAIESVNIEFERSDGSTRCNRMIVAKQNKATGAAYGDWSKSRKLVMAASGDQDRGTMKVTFTDGSLYNVHNHEDYDNDYMKYHEGTDNPYTPLTLMSKKTSDFVNGMEFTVYGVRLNFRNYTINVLPADVLPGHEGNTPGQLTIARTQTPGQNSEEATTSTRYAYEKVNFNNKPADYAYLDHLAFGDGTAIDPKYYEIGGTSATLDMNDDFFSQYHEHIDSQNSIINIKPVYDKKSVKLTINTNEHGGIEVEGVKYPRGIKGKEITIHAGDKLKVKPYDVEEDYFFSSYEMIATGLNGKGDSKKIIYSQAEPDNMDIGNYNYTLEPFYTFDGTSVIIKTDNIPEGCGISKKEWTYKTDRIRSRQILTIKATTAEGYRAKWTITSNTHEWHGKTFYGDTLYHKIGGPTDEIKLEFEQCTNMQYVKVNGKALKQEATIKNPPFLKANGVYLGSYVPAANASVQIGEFSSLTKQDGSYTIFSHTESTETTKQLKQVSRTAAGPKRQPDDPHVDHSKMKSVPTGAGVHSLGKSGEQTYYRLNSNMRNTQLKLKGDVTLCLNGHSLTSPYASTSAITVQEGGTLNLCDCQGKGTVSGDELAIYGVGSKDKPATVNIYGGTISSKSSKAAIGCERANIYGGMISSSHGDALGSASNSQTNIYNIYGGEINAEKAGIRADKNGAVVNISGGKVYGKESGINTPVSNDTETATVSLSGGVVESDGAGIRLQGANSMLNLAGGTVTSKNSSAVYCSNESCQIQFSGSYTNLSGAKNDIDTPGVIYINEKLTPGKKAYRLNKYDNRLNAPFTRGWGAQMANAQASDYFVVADSAYTIVRSGSELMMAATDTGGPVSPGEPLTPSEPSSGGNVTTYLKAGPNETRTVKVIHNGLEQVYYLQITGDLTGVSSSPSSPYVAPNPPSLNLDFFGEGPTPSKINTLLGKENAEEKDAIVYPDRMETSEQIEMRNYSVGFELTLVDVLDEDGEDLIDKVNFYIYNKDNIFKTMHTVERETKGQTTYRLDHYMAQDDEGNVGIALMNGLLDFADKDKIFVELVGTMKDENGNKVEDADMSYGLYDSGIRFQEKLDALEIQLKDVEPSSNGLPTVDVLGQMLPTLKLGKLGISAVISGNTMEFSIGFDVKKLNTSIYDSWEAEEAQKMQNLSEQIEDETYRKNETQKELDSLTEIYKADELELAELSQKPNPTYSELQRIQQLHTEMDEMQVDMTALNDDIANYNKSINANQKEFDALNGSPKEEDPLEPAAANEGDKKLDVTKPVTPEEITNVTEVTGPELNPVDKDGLWKGMKDRLMKEAEKSGMKKPKSDSLQGHGTVSANLGIDVGISVRFKMEKLNTGLMQWCFDKALIYAKVQGGISAMYYFIIPNFPIPMYAGANFNASVGVYAGMGSEKQITVNEMGEESFDGSELYFSGDIPVTLGIEGFVGMGLKSLLAVELGIGFLQKFDFAYASNGGQVGTGMSSFYGYVQTNVLFFSFKWKFAQVNWKYELYNTTEEAKKNMQKMMADNGLGSDAALSEFTVEDTPTVHYYGETKTRKFKKLSFSYSQNDSTVLAQGLTRTVSDVVPLGDGKYLMAFEGIRAEADCPNDMKPNSADYAYNSGAIYLSYYDGTKWSTPVILQNDDTLDAALQVEEMGDDILISWSSADHKFTKEEIVTDEMKEDGQAIKADATIKVLSSLDVYATVLKKSEVPSFVTGSAADRQKKIDRLTEDQALTDDQKKTIQASLAEGAKYLGYGHQNGQAVCVGDQIYLFYDTVDYNHWKNGKKPENLSDIVDAKGYILYKIYDKKSGKWIEDYADSNDKEVYEKLGFTMGQRMADIHLNVSDSDKKVLPMVSQMDAQAIKVKGEDRIAITYLVDSDGNSSTSMEDQTLFIAFMKPASIADNGKVTKEAEWSIPLQMNTELSHITDPQMVQTKKNGEDTVYLIWADDEKLMFSNLTQLFKKLRIEDDEAGTATDSLKEGEVAPTPHTPIEVSTTQLENGKKVEVYTMMEGIEPRIAILGNDENGFQYNNGYRLAADDNGHIYTVWAQSSGSSQGLYLSAMSTGDDGAGSEVWSKPRALGWDEKYGGKYLTNPSIAVDKDGTIILGHNAYNLKNVTTKDDNGNRILDTRTHADDTFCVTVEKAIGSPILEDIELSNDYPKAGEDFTVTAMTGNDGFLAAEKINVKAELVQTKGNTETVLETKTQSFANVKSGHKDEVRIAFTMKQEYLNAAKNDGASYQIHMTASEKKMGAEGDYAETASATADIKTGAHYVFTHENVEGYRCRDIKRDTAAGTVQVGKQTGENRYLYSATVVNDGNLPAEDMKVAMFASNENAFASTRDKNGTYEGTAEELTEYYKTHSASESVAHNKNFRNWISTKSFLAQKVKSLGVGESTELDVITAKIPDSMYSKMGGLDLMLAVYDNAAKGNAATKNEGFSTMPVSIVEEENVRLSLLYGKKKAGNTTVTGGSTTTLTAVVLPLNAAPDYNVLWESSNPQVATVDNGDVTAVGSGTTTIKARLMKDGKETMSRSVNITVTGTSGSQTPSGGNSSTGTATASPAPTVTQTPSGNAATSAPPLATQAPSGTDSPDISAPTASPTATETPQSNDKKQVKITFKGNKGKIQGNTTKNVTIGKKYGKLPKAVRKGYTFKGWYTKKSGGTKITKNTKVTKKSAHSLYAHWNKVKAGKAQIKKLTVKKGGKLKITLKPAKAVDGYQIRYSPKKKFPKKNTKKLATKKAAATLKNLKKNKTLFVKARAYKLDSTGKKVYGKYSKVKKKKL